MGPQKKKSAFVVLLASMLLVTACGNGSKSDSASTDSSEQGKKKERVVTVYEDAKRAESVEVKKKNEDFTKATGIKVEMNVVPGDGIEVYKKIDVDMISGEKTDVIRLTNPILIDKYGSNGWLYSLDDLMKKENYDAKKIYGDYLPKFADGKTYVLPDQAGKWAVYYNKKIFDDAGVPYPSGNWTWNDYIATAKKLTNSAKGIYGSYMLDYDNYMYMLARQHNVSGYKADGTSNYDDPAFKEALKFFGDLGNVEKIQPSWLEFKSKKLSWDGFMSGSYGMHFIGTWYTNQFKDKTTYPRDWKVGITQLPVPADGKGNNNFGIVAGYGINKNAEHAEDAYTYVKWMAENSYKYNGNLPARVDLSKEDINKLFQKTSDELGGEISAEELNKALISNDLGFVDEKITGPGSTEYSNIILQEADLYLVGQKSLDDTIQSIKKRADQAIKDAGGK
ncbi:multiple sugar transport system substrate-binding protein [Paenibacillus shirakamiensis]|uniref:Multiple sugar transport system substrate-binding protein n=1 Tax=Paenibacillus shirakamiensis TaxID=1265935 RepID=A0ABS4JED7_9BACL|nr:multiple sugar transport system substrate-binding protein [Paenibacillus shirakamiensis]